MCFQARLECLFSIVAAVYCALVSDVCVSELVTELYPRKPQLVEQKVLPFFWKLLSSSGNSGSVKAAAAKLAEALHAHMGRTLVECAASQPASVQCDLNELLRAQHTHAT